MSHISNQSAGTFGGTILAVVGVLDPHDMLKTAILAAIGAVVSFIVSTILKRLFKSKRNDRSKK
jgi:mannitol-specific phosphotransferase system IIBC component